MTRPLAVVCVATLLAGLSMGAEVEPAAGAAGLAQQAIVPIHSVAVDGGILVLTGPDGQQTTIPDGTFLGHRGSSVKVLRGRITEYAPPGVGDAGVDDRDAAPEPLLTLFGARVEAGRVWFVTRRGREVRLADGVYANANGAAVVVVGGAIVGLRVFAETLSPSSKATAADRPVAPCARCRPRSPP